jgi:hypothetical protein
MRSLAFILVIYISGCGIAMLCFMFGRLPLLERRNWPWPVIFFWPCVLLWPVFKLCRRLLSK